MPIDEAKLDARLDWFVIDPGGTGHVTVPNRSQPSPMGTWTIDPAQSTVSFAWRKLQLWTITGQLHCMGVIHLDGLPPVGVVRFEQPSGLPVLTIALDPASIETRDADLDARLLGVAWQPTRTCRLRADDASDPASYRHVEGDEPTGEEPWDSSRRACCRCLAGRR
jgi:hypothetical protein